MEFIFELIFEIILEGFFGVTVHNPKLKTWIKTVIFLVVAEIIPALMLVSGISAILRDDVGSGVFIIALGAALTAGFVAGAVYGHRRDWKQE